LIEVGVDFRDWSLQLLAALARPVNVGTIQSIHIAVSNSMPRIVF